MKAVVAVDGFVVAVNDVVVEVAEVSDENVFVAVLDVVLDGVETVGFVVVEVIEDKVVVNAKVGDVGFVVDVVFVVAEDAFEVIISFGLNVVLNFERSVSKFVVVSNRFSSIPEF